MLLISQLPSSPRLRILSEGASGVFSSRLLWRALLCLLMLLALFGGSGARAQSNAAFVSQSLPTAMATGAVYNVTVSMRNTGNSPWSSASAYFIGSQNPENNATWGGARVAVPASVAPGGQANFAFQVTAPRTPGIYNFQWRMAHEGVEWFGAYSPNVAVTVTAPAQHNGAQIIGVSAPAVMTQGQRYTIGVTMKNSGNTTWPAGSAYTLGSTNPQNTMLWGVNRVALAGAVAPGQQAAFSFPVTAPAAGSYTMGWGMVQEGVEWFGATAATVVKVNASSPVTINVSRSPSTMTAGQPFTLSWSSTNATSVSRVCTSTGNGFAVNDAPAINGSASGTASAAWVGYPSNCVWTARGAAGSATFNETMVTNAAATAEVVTYIHTDGLGSPVARTDSAGRVVSRTRYEPYGLTAGGATPTIGFTGHVNDADTGLVYMQQRYYDPVAGRFLSIDPVTTDANTGGSFNRYAYANNNPSRYIDEDGREARDIQVNCMSGNCTTYGSLSSQRAGDTAIGVGIGATAGAAIGAGLSGVCDAASGGICIPANPSIVAAGAALGGAAGGVLIPPVLASSRELAKNIAALVGPIKQEGQASHHIVAENDPRAVAARQVLVGVGMNVNSAFNGMTMSTPHHQSLHTDLYHISVGAALYGSTSYAQVATRLTAIRAQIYMGLFPY